MKRGDLLRIDHEQFTNTLKFVAAVLYCLIHMRPFLLIITVLNMFHRLKLVHTHARANTRTHSNESVQWFSTCDRDTYANLVWENRIDAKNKGDVHWCLISTNKWKLLSLRCVCIDLEAIEVVAAKLMKRTSKILTANEKQNVPENVKNRPGQNRMGTATIDCIVYLPKCTYLHTLIGLRYVFELIWYLPVRIRFCPVFCRFPALQLPLTTNHWIPLLSTEQKTKKNELTWKQCMRTHTQTSKWRNWNCSEEWKAFVQSREHAHSHSLAAFVSEKGRGEEIRRLGSTP